MLPSNRIIIGPAIKRGTRKPLWHLKVCKSGENDRAGVVGGISSRRMYRFS